jgi:hypothetical protein
VVPRLQGPPRHLEAICVVGRRHGHQSGPSRRDVIARPQRQIHGHGAAHHISRPRRRVSTIQGFQRQGVLHVLRGGEEVAASRTGALLEIAQLHTDVDRFHLLQVIPNSEGQWEGSCL